MAVIAVLLIHLQTGRRVSIYALAALGRVASGQMTLRQAMDVLVHTSIREGLARVIPQAQAVGVHAVWVNGRVVFQDGKTTGVYSGRVLRRSP